MHEPLKTAAEVWSYISSNKHTDSKWYDKDLEEQLLQTLVGPKSGKPLTQVLEQVTVEQFVQTLFQTVAPFCRMMSDLCVFMEKIGAKKARKNIRIQFNFDDLDRQLDFDLKHFREQLEIWREMTVDSYEHITLSEWFAPIEILRKHSNKTISQPETNEWITRYYLGIIDEPDIEIPITGVKGLDIAMEKLFEFWKGVTKTIRLFSSSVETLKKVSYKYFNNDIDRQLIRPEELLLIPPFEANSGRYIIMDNWAPILLHYILEYCASLKTVPMDSRESIAKELLVELNKILIPLQPKEKNISEKINTLSDMLRLPEWERRYELYQAWTLTLIDKALEDETITDYHVEYNIEGETLALSFGSSKIATITTPFIMLNWWWEKQYPLVGNPSNGRINNIQPDMSLEVQSPEKCQEVIAIVEIKHYKKESHTNFRKAINAYAESCKSAEVYLLDYGPINSKIKHLKYPNRTWYRGDVVPGSKNAIEFIDRLREHIRLKYIHNNWFPKVEWIALDVSGSMAELSRQVANWEQLLRDIVKMAPKASLLVVNEKIRQQWYGQSEESFKRWMNYSPTGQTDLAGALTYFNPENLLLITDRDGWEEVLRSKFQPQRTWVIETDGSHSIFPNDDH